VVLVVVIIGRRREEEEEATQKSVRLPNIQMSTPAGPSLLTPAKINVICGDRQTDRETERQNRQTDRQKTGRQTKQTDKTDRQNVFTVEPGLQ